MYNYAVISLTNIAEQYGWVLNGKFYVNNSLCHHSIVMNTIYVGIYK